MTADEIRAKIEFLSKILATWQEQINGIAEREAQAAIAQHPAPYENAALTATKDRLVAQSEELIKKLKILHTALAGPPLP